ncbi:AAA family ATPase [Georgenia thermotolerans]|nr:AAA family ATPase [Georgenia thermotolerans]
MATQVVIGCADQTMAAAIRAQLGEAADVELLAVAESTSELVRTVVERDPQLVVVHDALGPEPVHQAVRDLSLRRPASVVLMVVDGSAESISDAMNAGARGVLTHPFSFTEVQQRVMGAIEWSRHLRRMLTTAGEDATTDGSRGRVVAVTGTKGGVGTTTIATHLAWDVRRQTPGLKVLLVDLDLEKGDVTSLIEAKYRTSVADLAKVADDLSAHTVMDAVFEHESGLSLLLPPEDIRDVEWVTPAAVRLIMALLRQQFDLVVVDAGAHVTPVQAAVVELADEVVAVVTPDLISVRALRRNVAFWESLAARKPAEVRVLVNKHSRAQEVQPETLRQLSPAPMLPAVLPEITRSLEKAVNSRAPELVDDKKWWERLREVGSALGVLAALERRREEPPPPEADGGAPSTRRGRRRQGAGLRRRRDEGSASVELLGVLPVALLVLALLWQLGMAGLTYVWTGHAAAAAARTVALGERDGGVIERAAVAELPAGVADAAAVSYAPASEKVTVRVDVPLAAPGLARLPWEVEVSRNVVKEPRL